MVYPVLLFISLFLISEDDFIVSLPERKDKEVLV